MEEGSKRKEFLDVIVAAVKEMKDKQNVLLLRGDKATKDDFPKYRALFSGLADLAVRVHEGEDLTTMVRLKTALFEKEESFYLNLFETNSFDDLFALYEYE